MEKKEKTQTNPKKPKGTNGFFSRVFKPFKVIRYTGLEFLVWIAYSLVGGLIGILVSLAKHWWFDSNKGLSKALSIEFGSGSFYTYSIAMLASVLSMVFISFVRNKELEFKRYKLAIITICILVLVFGGVFYALSVDLGVPSTFSFCNSQVWLQTLVFVISVVIAIYAFSVTRLDDNKEKFEDINDSSFDNRQKEDTSIDSKNYYQENPSKGDPNDYNADSSSSNHS